MSVFKNLFKRSAENQQFDKAVNQALLEMFGTTASSQYITEEFSLNISAVWACVQLLADSISTMPLHLFERTPQGRKLIDNHHAIEIIHRPNEYISQLDLIYHLMVGVTLWGNGYARLHRDNASRITKISLLQPTDVTPILSPDDILFYRVKGENVNYEDIIHLKGLSVDGIVGKSPIQVHRENLILTNNVQSYGSKFFTEGGNTAGVFEYPSALKEDAFKRLKMQLAEQFQGIKNAHTPLLLEGGMKYNRINIPLEDAQFLGTRKFQKNEIATIFKVPPHMIGDLERATFSNIEHQAQEFITYSLMPYLVKLETELNFKILLTSERNRFYFKFNIKGLLRSDSKTRSEYYKNLNLIGVYSPNEIRELEEMNGYEGGDSHYIQQNMQTTAEANSQKKDE